MFRPGTEFIYTLLYIQKGFRNAEVAVDEKLLFAVERFAEDFSDIFDEELFKKYFPNKAQEENKFTLEQFEEFKEEVKRRMEE